MRFFEILIGGSAISTDGGPFVPDDRLTYGIPDEAQELLEPILGPYDQDPMWYFDKLNFGRPPAPWALACLDREYTIAGHVATSRPPNAGIAFAPYNQVPNPMPNDFVPGVGVLTFASKGGLERSAANSHLFATVWNALQKCSPERRWLVILDPPSQEWLAQVLPGDRERWLLGRRS
jgi:hypothetical protein